jgi:hypothetical protein
LAIRERTLANSIIGFGLILLAVWVAIAVGGGFAKLVLGLTEAMFIIVIPELAYLIICLGVYLAFRFSRQSGESPSIISHGPPVFALIVLIGLPLYFIWFH